MQTNSHYHDDARRPDMRLDVMYLIADCAYAMRAARLNPRCGMLAARAEGLELLLVDAAHALWTRKAFHSFEDVVLAYDATLS